MERYIAEEDFGSLFDPDSEQRAIASLGNSALSLNSDYRLGFNALGEVIVAGNGGGVTIPFDQIESIEPVEEEPPYSFDVTGLQMGKDKVWLVTARSNQVALNLTTEVIWPRGLGQYPARRLVFSPKNRDEFIEAVRRRLPDKQA